MDVSPKTLREVEFREKMRGYHPEDVDQFLERVAAGIEVLQDRLRQAIDRAQRAEQAANDAGGNDDSLRRTLLLAQRTADLAVQEAREQAARIVSSAEQQAQSMIGEADQRIHAVASESDRRAQAVLADSERRAQAMLSDAEQRARRGHEDTLVEIRAELATLEATRQRLQMDVDAMTRWVSEHRNRLRSALEDSMTKMEQIAVNPPPAAGVPYSFDGQANPSSQASVGSLAGGDPAGSWAPQSAAASWSPSASPAGATWAPSSTSAAPAAPVATTQAQPTRSREDTVAWQPPEPDLPTDVAGDADPYFAELRRAISDQDPLGPRTDGDPRGTLGASGAPAAPTADG